MNTIDFLQQHWYVILVVFLAITAMIAVSIWLIRCRHDRSYLLVSWILLLLILATGTWRTEREIDVFHDVWKENFLRITKAFASATELMGHWKINRDTLPTDPLYREIWNIHAAWCRDVPQVGYVYTLRLRPNETNKVDWIVSCESDINHDDRIEGSDEVGEGLYQEYSEWFDVYGKGFSGQLAIDEDVESNEYGRWVTVISPLRDPNGTVEAILGVDFHVNQWEEMTRQMRTTSTLLFAAVIAIYLSGVIFLAILQRSIRKITETNRELIETKKFADMAARAKSDFLANMSHEIRTPMNAVLGFTDILTQRLALRGTPQEREESEGIVEIIKKNSNCLLTIINDILDFSRMEANLLEVESVPVSIKQVIEDICLMERPNAMAKFLDFTVEYKEPIPDLILSDPTRLRQILMNLVNNAIKFTEKGGVRVLCSTIAGPNPVEHENETKGIPAPMILRVDVIDTGIGISGAQLKGLFSPFTQADTSSTRRFSGAGLGLSIAKKLAVLLDGEITVASKTGIGSTFSLLVHVFLPTEESLRVAKEKAEATKPDSGVSTFDSGVRLLQKLKAEKGKSEGSETEDSVETKSEKIRESLPLDGVRILLVEDMVVNQLVISTQLRDVGAKVEIAGNGEIGLQKISADSDVGLFFDIVLMDMQMPVMDGYEATRILREQGYKRPIVAITAHALSGDREKTIYAGCDDYIAKPVDRKVLIETIKKYLK